MITDTFEILDTEYDDTKVELRCRHCGEEFEADFALLTPLNVSYELGYSMSFTVICPACGAADITNQRDCDLVQLKLAEASLAAEVDVMMAKQQVKFTIEGESVTKNEGKFSCLTCATVFPARSRSHPDGPLNIEYEPDGTMRLSCPTCGEADEVHEDNAQARLTLVSMHRALHEVRENIDRIEEEQRKDEEESDGG